MDRRTFLAAAATGAAAGCPSAPGTSGGMPTPAGPETPTGREVVRLARNDFPRPFGVDAVDARAGVAATSSAERVAANRRWVADHVAAYERAGERYRAFLRPVLGPGRGLRTWYDGPDDSEPAPWIRAVTDALGEPAWVDRQAWLGTFDPGSDAFEYVFGGRRTYDLDGHSFTFAGTDFQGVDPDTYLYSFDPEAGDRAEVAATVLAVSGRVWERIYDFLRAFREGSVTHAKAGSFNGAVVLVGGPTMVDAETCRDCGDAAALRVAMNHLNRLALLLAEFGFPPRPLDV